jgi:catechol 2,3-dioxygenase-like lactoylglutathione lyase family enzyme
LEKEDTMRPHISLDVRDLEASVEFYRAFFSTEPQKQSADYAKFDLSTPPLNLSMMSSPAARRAVNHFGIEVDSAASVAEWQRRLEEKGLVQKVEQNVECCYARQDKVWVMDPDGNKWEIFVVLEQLPPVTETLGLNCCAPSCCT